MPSGTGATKSGCKVTIYLLNSQTFSRFFVDCITKRYVKGAVTLPLHFTYFSLQRV